MKGDDILGVAKLVGPKAPVARRLPGIWMPLAILGVTMEDAMLRWSNMFAGFQKWF